MSSVVCKFGGSSLCNADMFRRVREIILSCPERKYIVLSAPGKRFPGDEKITDLLYRACATGDHSIFSRIYRRYASIRSSLAPSFDLEGEFERICAETDKSADYIASRGEYLCAKLFAAFIEWPFVDAAELFFFSADGCIDHDKSDHAIRDRLSGLTHAVIPGFYGSMPDGSIRTFARGGGDVSGALLAAGVKAELYENWTDVSGLCSADPKLAADAVHHPTVSMNQMEALARAGAGVLHPDALLPLMGGGADILLKNTRLPHTPGTRISERFSGVVPCVTGKRMFMRTDNERDLRLQDDASAGGIPVAAITAFGLSEDQLTEIDTLLHPIHIIHMQDHKQIIIAEAAYADAIRKIHGILMQGRKKNPAP